MKEVTQIRAVMTFSTHDTAHGTQCSYLLFVLALLLLLSELSTALATRGETRYS